MFKYFLQAFKLTNDNIILTTPLVFFLFVFSLYLAFAQNAPLNLISISLLILTIAFMLAAFLAGWFYMVKCAVDLSKNDSINEEERAQKSFGLMREIPFGVGEYFLQMLIGLILYLISMGLLSLVIYKVGMHYIGDVGLTSEQVKSLVSSSTEMKSIITSLTHSQLKKLNAWNILVFGSLSIVSFLTLFWVPEVILRTKNVFFAFFRSLKILFKNFFSSIVLVVYISAINLFVSIFNAIAVSNSILYFVSMLVYFYFIVYVIVLIFLYYDNEISKNS